MISGQASGGNWLGLRLIGQVGGPTGLGSKVSILVGGGRDEYGRRAGSTVLTRRSLGLDVAVWDLDEDGTSTYAKWGHGFVREAWAMRGDAVVVGGRSGTAETIWYDSARRLVRLRRTATVTTMPLAGSSTTQPMV